MQVIQSLLWTSRANNRQGREAPVTDEQLLERIVRRDHAAFQTLLDRHMKRVVSLAQGVLGAAADADDVAQEVFLRLWHRPQTFDAARARFSTWLHRIVVNLCIDRRRADRFSPLDPGLEPEADDPPLMELIDKEHRSTVVHANLERLSVRQRTALVLFYFEELSQRDAALAMNLSESAFESLLHRARRALASTLGPTGPNHEAGI